MLDLAYATRRAVRLSGLILTALFTTSFHPPLQASCDFCTPFNFAWSPPTVHSNCSERLWLYARAILVVWEKRARLLPFNDLLKFLPSPPRLHLRLRLCCGLTTAAKTRIQRSNLVLSYGWKPHDIWQRWRYCGAWTAWSSYSQARAFATIAMYSWWQSGAIGCVPNLKSRSGGGWKLVVNKAVLPFAKVLRKSKLSEPPSAEVRFYNNAFITTKNKSYFIKLVNKTIKEVLLYNFKYIAA